VRGVTKRSRRRADNLKRPIGKMACLRPIVGEDAENRDGEKAVAAGR